MQVPNDAIERAVKRAAEKNQNLEELTFEAYGPGGSALIIEAVSDSKNRAVAEVKKILSDNEGKWAEAGSVRWAFEQTADETRLPAGRQGSDADSRGRWHAKFTQELSPDDRRRLEILVEALEDHPDVQEVFTNVAVSA
jgi:transcriptional/translational regulatory protein YebC/TACO1